MAKNKKKSGGKGGGKKDKGPVVHVISENRKAKFRYEILDSVECGVALKGSEVKSLRDGKLSLDEAGAGSLKLTN